jgi:ubiquinone/menaquinone biosynthesis C-methylase UbiE
MDPNLQRRLQRYGWDRAAPRYEGLWAEPLAAAQGLMLELADLRPGHNVLDVACGTGLVTFAAAQVVGSDGSVLGVDISGGMVEACMQRAQTRRIANVAFERMDAELLDLPASVFDVALCAFGLMYLSDPAAALREMRRVLQPGGRMAAAVWGARARCGWAAAFAIVDAEVASDVCPLFFQHGEGEALARACEAAGFVEVELHRLMTTLNHKDDTEAYEAVFLGGPLALPWAHFDEAARTRVRLQYLAAIAPWRIGSGFQTPAEYVVVTAWAPED